MVWSQFLWELLYFWCSAILCVFINESVYGHFCHLDLSLDTFLFCYFCDAKHQVMSGSSPQ